MYSISALAAEVGLSRSTLLYYEKLKLIQGRRRDNGYRYYNDSDVQRLRLVQQLHTGGLTLKECKACVDAKIERQLLHNRLQQLDAEIAQKQQARELLAALLGETGLKHWHESIDKIAPEAHLDWLIKQGFNEKEALRLKWLSKDMNEHEHYMADFDRIFTELDRLGPGSEADTLKALAHIPFAPQRMLEVGCGKGIATTVLASYCSAMITAVDNDQPALSRLSERVAAAGLNDRVTTQCASMTELPFRDSSFDVIWAEGSAYIMGVTKALARWRRLLNDNGVLVLSDLVWRTDTPSTEAQEYWQQGYPDMTTTTLRIQQAQAAGYQVIANFALSEAAWQAYYQPLQARTAELKTSMPHSAAVIDIEAELTIYQQYRQEFDYQFLLLQKLND